MCHGYASKGDGGCSGHEGRVVHRDNVGNLRRAVQGGGSRSRRRWRLRRGRKRRWQGRDYRRGDGSAAPGQRTRSGHPRQVRRKDSALLKTKPIEMSKLYAFDMNRAQRTSLSSSEFESLDLTDHSEHFEQRRVPPRYSEHCHTSSASSRSPCRNT